MRIWVCVLAGLILFAWQDVLLWGRIFERDQLWQYIGIYHRGWFVMLWSLAIVGVLWTWPDWRRGLLQTAMLITLAYSGLEDLLYYVLQLRPVPELLPWLDQHPLIFWAPVTRENLTANVLLWLVGWAGVTRALRKR